jgi:hypothetical protein
MVAKENDQAGGAEETIASTAQDLYRQARGSRGSAGNHGIQDDLNRFAPAPRHGSESGAWTSAPGWRRAPWRRRRRLAWRAGHAAALRRRRVPHRHGPAWHQRVPHRRRRRALRHVRRAPCRGAGLRRRVGHLAGTGPPHPRDRDGYGKWGSWGAALSSSSTCPGSEACSPRMNSRKACRA